MKKIYIAILSTICTLHAFAQCPPTTAQVDLDINNVRARLLNGGDLWWNPASQINRYEVPNGSGKNSIYAGSLWIGAIDNLGQPRVAAQTYRQGNANDFWAGPISQTATSPAQGEVSMATCNFYDRFWGVTRAEVIAFQGGAPATLAIQEWPGNGNTAIGELPFLAPFFDANNDGIYNYNDGDYPEFNLSGNFPIDPWSGLPTCDNTAFGDKAFWWVFNDVGNIKTSTNSAAMGLEVRAQAFAYASADEDLNNATFYQYQIINRSSNTYFQTHIGMWCDGDIGNPGDDYVGCDVGLSLGYIYNGDSFDDGLFGYGANPPACGIAFLRGPEADAMDGIDNNRNGTIDEPGEDILMSKFVYYRNINNFPTGNPNTVDDYYEYMTAYWLDGQKITFGEAGRNPVNPPTNYMFSDGTDPDFPAQVWNMANAGLMPADTRWLQTAGAFTMAPGEVNYLRTAVLWAQDLNGGANASVAKLKVAAQKIQLLFDNCFTTTNIAENGKPIQIQITPNPFSSDCKLDLHELKGREAAITVYDLQGKCIEKTSVEFCTGDFVLGSSYHSGVYLVKINSGNKTYSARIVKM